MDRNKKQLFDRKNYRLRLSSVSSSSTESSVSPPMSSGFSHIIKGRSMSVMIIPITAPPKCAECPMLELFLRSPKVE